MVAAMDGKYASGEQVAATTKSMSAGARPDRSSACCAAASPRSDAQTSGAATRRSAMPVRSRIHASLVSMRVEISSLVTIRSGTAAPMETMPAVERRAPITRAPRPAGRT